jgi:hypothetical protein
MLVGLAFVFPLAVYLLILANLNRRTHPVMVAGTWDFSEVLLACSGFLLFGGPCVLTSFNERWRGFWLHNNWTSLRYASREFWNFWITVGVLYFLVILIGAVYLLYRRRLATAIYNIELPLLQDYISLALDRLGLDWMRIDNRFFIGAHPETSAAKETGITAVAPTGTATSPKVTVELDAFPRLRHVTLHWSSNGDGLRDAIEMELAKGLSEVRHDRNPIAVWMITLATILFAIMVGTLVTLFVLGPRVR